MAYSSFNTALSINRWGELMGIDPITLNGVKVGTCLDVRQQPNCEKVWVQDRWQSQTNATREQLGEAIQSATRDIEWKLGYPVSPVFIENENVLLRDAEGEALARGQTIILHTGVRMINAAGQRETFEFTSVETGRYDKDGDGFEETVFYKFNTAEPEEDFDISDWELILQEVWPGTHTQMGKEYIMPSPEFCDVARVGFYTEVTVYYNVWDAMDMGLILQIPGRDGYVPPDICTDDAQPTLVLRSKRLFEVQPGATFAPPPQARVFCRADDCRERCVDEIIPGIVEVIDSDNGIIALTLAQESWTDVEFPNIPAFLGYECIDCSTCITCKPYRVEFDYHAGSYDKDGHVVMEVEIAKMAAARLPAEVCECGNFGQVNIYRDDYAVYDKSAPRRATTRLLDNPFGTKRGEVEAWLAIQKYIGDVQYAGLL